MKLYEITKTFQELSEILDNELTPEQEQLLATLWKKNELKLEEKAENIVFLEKETDADIEKISAEIKRLQERKKVLQNKKEKLRKFLLENMLTAGMRKIKTALFSITVRKPTESIDFDDDFNVANLPEDLQTVKIEPNKTAIKKFYSSTNTLPKGVKIKRKNSLLIK
jgi:chromosome condensin MukBEF ATPase and DNA-binding subunit MukB